MIQERITTKDLIGQWVSDPRDKKALAKYGNISLSFDENGRLVYTIYEKDKEQKIILTYRLE